MQALRQEFIRLRYEARNAAHHSMTTGAVFREQGLLVLGALLCSFVG